MTKIAQPRYLYWKKVFSFFDLSSNSLDSEKFLRALSGLEVREGFSVGFWNHDHHEDGVEGRDLEKMMIQKIET